MLQLNNITKYFNAGTIDETVLFDNFNFRVEDGEFVSIIGSNGSGKTTLLNLTCGSMKAESGTIIFNKRDLTKMTEFQRAKYIGRVFQDPKMGTCANLTVLENMALADNKNKSFGMGVCVNKKRAEYYMSLLEACEMGLEQRLNVVVGSLSGGQRQALALVIANMTDIEMLILDEHTAALDPKSSEKIMELTDKFVSKKKITTMMVTHNLRFALNYGNRLVMMHEGNVIFDLAGKDKGNAKIEDVLKIFNDISIEVGN